MDKENYEKIDHIDENPYGIRYSFTLAESVDDVPEYLSPLPCIQSLCEEYGLVVEKKMNFDVGMPRKSHIGVYSEQSQDGKR